MAVISLDCPNCGAKLSPDDSKRSASCQYCGASFQIARTIAQPPATSPPMYARPTATPAAKPAGARMALVTALMMTALSVGAAAYFSTRAQSGSMQAVKAVQAALGGQGSDFMWDSVGGPPVVVVLDGSEQILGRIRLRGGQDQLYIAMFAADSGAERYRVGPFGSYSDAYRSTHFAVLGERLLVTDYRGKLRLFALATGVPLEDIALTDRADKFCLVEKTGEEPRLYLAQVDEREFLVDPIAPALKAEKLPPACDADRFHHDRDGDPVAASEARLKLAPKVDGIKVSGVHRDGSLAVARGVKAPGTAYPMAFGFDPESREVRWNSPVPAVDLASVRERDNAQDTLAGGRYFATYGEGSEHWHLAAFDAQTGARLWDNKLRSIFAVDWLHGLSATDKHVFLVRMHTVEIYDAQTGALKTTLSADNYDG